jgi:dynein light intermediate chain 1, cytosolic
VHDPRGAFRNPADLEQVTGVVGPLGGSSSNLPNVERALHEMETGISGTVSERDTAAGTRGVRAPPRPNVGVRPPPITSPTGVIGGRPPPSPNPGVASPTSASSLGQSQHEVLQNFFRGLLDRQNAGPAAARPKVNGTTTTTSNDEAVS